MNITDDSRVGWTAKEVGLERLPRKQQVEPGSQKQVSTAKKGPLESRHQEQALQGSPVQGHKKPREREAGVFNAAHMGHYSSSGC